MEWLNYHHLLYFWVVAKEGSVVRASEELRLAHPTISGQIHRLEEVLGEKLFARRGRSLVLTEAGRVAFRYADEIFSRPKRTWFQSGSEKTQASARSKAGYQATMDARSSSKQKDKYAGLSRKKRQYAPRAGRLLPESTIIVNGCAITRGETSPGFVEAVWFKSGCHCGGLTGELPVVVCLSFRRWDVADWLEQAVVVELGNPFQCRQLHGLLGLPGRSTMDQFGLVVE